MGSLKHIQLDEESSSQDSVVFSILNPETGLRRAIQQIIESNKSGIRKDHRISHIVIDVQEDSIEINYTTEPGTAQAADNLVGEAIRRLAERRKAEADQKVSEQNKMEKKAMEKAVEKREAVKRFKESQGL